MSVHGKKRKLKQLRMSSVLQPPQRFFNYEDVVKVCDHCVVARQNQINIFSTYMFSSKYIKKDFKLATLILKNVSLTLNNCWTLVGERSLGSGLVQFWIEDRFLCTSRNTAIVELWQTREVKEMALY